MARPKKQPADRRSVLLSCRLTPAERLQIEEAAKRAGLIVSDYLRQQALRGRVVLREHRALDHATFDQIRRIGVNLNQLARVANRTGFVPVEIGRAMAAVERVLARELGHAPSGVSEEGAGSSAPEGDGSQGRG